MTTTTKPDKSKVREYFKRRTHAEEDPPPSLDEIREQLGWHLIPDTGTVREVPD